ncbi:MAG: glycosyltransferase [Janthinobacterium lividum]
MKILSVAPHVPHDGIPHAGGAYLLHHLEELVRRGHEVTLLAPGTPTQLAAAPLAPAWLDVVVGPDVRLPRSRARVLHDAVYRRVMTAPPAPTAESIRSVLTAGLVVRAAAADLVELHWADYARFALALRRAGVRTPICVLEHDVDLNAGGRRVRMHAVGYRRWLGLLSAPLRRGLERRGLETADLVAVFKPADEEVIRRAGVGTPVQVIDPWLDPPSALHAPRTPGLVLFAGALWRRENEEALVWFLEQVWPRVSATSPSAQLQLVGAGPTPRLEAAARSTAAVELVGEVPDLVPYYEAASVFVAPLLTPGGLKFKVPQAMLCGLPVVATTVATEGVTEVAPPDALWAVVDDPVDFAKAVAAAVADPRRAAEVGRAAERWSRGFYAFSRSIARLTETYGRLVGGG